MNKSIVMFHEPVMPIGYCPGMEILHSYNRRWDGPRQKDKRRGDWRPTGPDFVWFGRKRIIIRNSRLRRPGEV